MALNILTNDIVAFPNIQAPSKKFGVDFGRHAAQKIFNQLIPPAQAKFVIHWYFLLDTDAQAVLQAALISAWGGGGNAAYDHGAWNGLLGADIAAALRSLGSKHYAAISAMRTPSVLQATRFTAANYSIANYLPPAGALGLGAAGKATRVMDQWFLSLGQTFGVHPQYVKEAFVATLGMIWDSCDPLLQALCSRSGVHGSSLRDLLPQLWGVAATPVAGYSTLTPHLNLNPSGQKKRKSKRKSRNYKRKSYY